MNKKAIICWGILVFVIGIILCSIRFANFAKIQDGKSACESAPYNNSGTVPRDSFPAHMVDESDTHLIFDALHKGVSIEVFDTFALPLLATDTAEYWYPQYLTTVIIVVDRAQTDIGITGWANLSDAALPVGMTRVQPYANHIFAAIAYAIQGENFSLSAAAEVLAPLYEQGHLLLNSVDAPILICYDYQAAAMIQAGRNLEIIIPVEGTLTFERGLLSKEPVHLPDNHDATVTAGFRLLDESNDINLYPPKESYRHSTKLQDYTHLNIELQSYIKVLRREVQHSWLYTSADGQEHHASALLYIAAIIIWGGTISHRAMQKSVRLSAMLTSIMLIGWVLVRMFKYLLLEESVAARYAWYGFYIFEFGLSLVLLWLASSIDKPVEDVAPPKWWKYFAIASGILTLGVMTNDFHQLAFAFDSASGNWNENYSYGPLYFAAIAAIAIQVLLSQIIMMKKCRKTPRNSIFIPPLTLYLLLGVYCVGYILRIPPAWPSDMTIVVGIFVLLSMEIYVRIGLIPVNTKYRQFFKGSPQKMQIIDHDGSTLLMAASSTAIDSEILTNLLANPGTSQAGGEDQILYADPINGGTIVWYEDIRILNELNREIAESVERLKAANTILEKSMTSTRSLTMPIARLALFSELEKNIRRHLDELTDMLRHIPPKTEQTKYLARVAVLVCYVKRKCHLFFLAQRTEAITTNELAVYADELAEFAFFTGFSCACPCSLHGSISLRMATIIYDLIYAMFSYLYEQDAKSLMVKIGKENNSIVVSTMQDNRIPLPGLCKEMLSEIDTAGGTVSREVLDWLDALGICITFPTGGEDNA